MAIIHKATLTQTKLELLEPWLPGRAWYPRDTADGLERIAACRFDDPDGEVGIEMLIVRSGDDPTVHVPLTYRAEPLPEAEHWLIGTTEHSVLGTRWVYDAVGDPVYLAALDRAIRTGATQAEEFVETPSGPERREAGMTVSGSGVAAESEPIGEVVRVEDGDPAVGVTDSTRLTIRRVLSAHPADQELTLTGSWPGLPKPVILATAE